MAAYGLNAFLLISAGAAFFAISVNAGRSGKLRKSIFFAVLAFTTGLLKIADDGFRQRSIAEIVGIGLTYAILSLLAVIVGGRMYQGSRD